MAEAGKCGGRTRVPAAWLLLFPATFIILSAAVAEGRQCYWCGPLAEQVHRSNRAPPCASGARHMVACEPGYDYCAIVATSPPYTESRYCVKLYQDECYPLFCNSTRTWKMVCPCRGDLCNGSGGEREEDAFAVLGKLVAKTHTRVKRGTLRPTGNRNQKIVNPDEQLLNNSASQDDSYENLHIQIHDKETSPSIIFTTENQSTGKQNTSMPDENNNTVQQEDELTTDNYINTQPFDIKETGVTSPPTRDMIEVDIIQRPANNLINEYTSQDNNNFQADDPGSPRDESDIKIKTTEDVKKDDTGKETSKTESPTLVQPTKTFVTAASSTESLISTTKVQELERVGSELKEPELVEKPAIENPVKVEGEIIEKNTTKTTVSQTITTIPTVSSTNINKSNSLNTTLSSKVQTKNIAIRFSRNSFIISGILIILSVGIY